MNGTGRMNKDGRLEDLQGNVTEIVPVILAGGKGMRLRPLTRPDKPKPFLKAFSGYSLMQETALRSAGISGVETALRSAGISGVAAPVVVCDALWAGKAQDELNALGFTARIVAEPMGRSTGAAIALAAFALMRDGGRDDAMLVLPSDHYVEDRAAFRAAVMEMREALARGGADVVLLGAQPDAPHARYGYICADERGGVEQFVEKPDVAEAQALLETGRAFWNTGVFMMRPSVYLDVLQRSCADIYDAVEMAAQRGEWEFGIFNAEAASYGDAPEISVDYAVMERLRDFGCKARLVRFDAYWRDVGCWGSLLRVKLIEKRFF
jgi:mannose-1-phosphate guanylyltransferase/mannose-6-phosphate isomerase